MNKKIWIVFLLGFSSGLPISLLTSTLQAWFSVAGLSVFATGLISLLGLPYAYRIIWVPILDHYPLFSLGKRRSWILLMQLLLLIGFNVLAWFTPEKHPHLMMGIAFMLVCCSATQDMAIEAHRTEYLQSSEQGFGASIAVFGFRLGLLVSGGLALILAAKVGWWMTYQIMGFLMLFGIVATLLSPEPSIAYSNQTKLSYAFIEPIKEFAKRPYILSIFLFLICFKLGEAFTATTSGIVMPFLIQGLSFSLDTIGYVNKITGIGAIIVGGLFAGFILLRYSLYKALLFFGLLQALTNLLFVALAIVGKNIGLLMMAVILDNLAVGMGSTAIVAFMMKIVDKRFTATQFAILTSIAALPRIFSGPIAALIQSQLGWIGLYELSVFMALLFIPFLLKIRKMLDTPTLTHHEQYFFI